MHSGCAINRQISESYWSGLCHAKMSIKLKFLLLQRGVFGIGEMPFISIELSALWLAFARKQATFFRSFSMLGRLR